MRRSFHEDVVEEVLAQIDDGAEVIKIEKKLGILRDRTVKWIWDAFGVLKSEKIVKKVRITSRSGSTYG